MREYLTAYLFFLGLFTALHEGFAAVLAERDGLLEGDVEIED